MKTILRKMIRALLWFRREVKKAWTFMETLIVIAIVILLTGTVGFAAFQFLGQASSAAAKSQIESFSMALNAYYFENRVFPSTSQGLEALWEKPTSSPIPNSWSKPYVSKPIPKDPWGNEYIYRNPGPNGLDFEVISYGADGVPGGDGEDADISSAQ